MLRKSCLVAHRVRDKAVNAHNFAFDTMTRVYRDAVYASDARHSGNPMHMESSVAPAPDVDTRQQRPSGNPMHMESSVAQAPAAGARRQRHSGVQLEVLRLFRDLMRETRRMEDAGTRKCLESFIREEFSKNSSIPRRCVTQIEWQMHYGKSKLEELRNMRSNTKFSIMR